MFNRKLKWRLKAKMSTIVNKGISFMIILENYRRNPKKCSVVKIYTQSSLHNWLTTFICQNLDPLWKGLTFRIQFWIKNLMNKRMKVPIKLGSEILWIEIQAKRNLWETIIEHKESQLRRKMRIMAQSQNLQIRLLLG